VDFLPEMMNDNLGRESTDRAVTEPLTFTPEATPFQEVAVVPPPPEPVVVDTEEGEEESEPDENGDVVIPSEPEPKPPAETVVEEAPRPSRAVRSSVLPPPDDPMAFRREASAYHKYPEIAPWVHDAQIAKLAQAMGIGVNTIRFIYRGTLLELRNVAPQEIPAELLV
jgi:hypothetical protein